MRKLAYAAVLVLLAAFASRQLLSSPRYVVAQGPPTVILAGQSCDGAVLRLTFTWTAGQKWDDAWLDLSLVDNGFIPGTFLPYNEPLSFPAEEVGTFFSIEGLSGWVSWVQWSGIAQGLTHYWRVNLRYGDTWYASPTQTFFSANCPAGAAPPIAPTPSPILPPISPSVSLTSDDVQERVKRLEEAVFGPSWSYGLSLESRIDSLESQVGSLESQVESLKSCLENLYIDRWGNASCH